jgi:stress response protein YsnF
MPSAPYGAPLGRGHEGAAAGANADAEMPLAAGERVVIPAIREEASVVRHEIEAGRVRVAKRVHEREEVVSAPVASERVRVERVPVGRTVDRAPEVRHEGDTTIVPVVEEVLVLERRILLKEEIRITRERAVVQSPPQRVRLRSEHVHVERVEPPKGG